jgi:hypothetical protein
MDNALLKKMRFQAGQRMLIMNAQEAYLDNFPQELEFDRQPEGMYDFVQLFVHSIAELEELGPVAVKAVNNNALLWISYPKKSSKIKTDLNRDAGWENITEAGYEGIALVSIDDTWSAMRFRKSEMIKSTGARRERLNNGNVRPPAQAVKDRVLEIPQDLQSALNDNSEAKQFFEGLSYSNRKEYVRWIIEAKREETRSGRVEKTLEKLTRGLKAPHMKE